MNFKRITSAILSTALIGTSFNVRAADRRGRTDYMADTAGSFPPARPTNAAPAVFRSHRLPSVCGWVLPGHRTR